MPSLRAAATTLNTSCTISGARPCEGSSSMSSFGLSSSARAIASISCSPPESWRPLLDLRSREAREQLVDARDGPRARALERHLQVFFDGQVGEDAAALGHVADAERGDAVGRPVGRRHGRRCARVPSRARRQAHQAAQRRGLAGAVAAEQRDDLAFAHLEADAVQDVALAVEGVQVLGLRAHRVHAGFPR